MMKFNNPNFLLYIVFVVALMILKIKQKRAGIKYSMASYLKSNLNVSKFRSRIFIVLRCVAMCSLAIALARPKIIDSNSNITRAAVDIVLVLDVSTSMKVVDFSGKTRLDAAKEAAAEFIKSRAGDRIGIVVFSGLPLLHCPLTFDHNTVLSLLSTISPGMIEGDTTSIGLGLGLALKYLNNSDTASKVVILLTDGADNGSNDIIDSAAKAAQELDIKLYSIGAGKPGPANLSIQDPNLGARLVRIEDELDEKFLQQIAEKTGGKYYRATSLNRFREIYSEINMMEKTIIEEELQNNYSDIYTIFLYIGLFLLLAELLFRFIYPGLFV